MSTVTSVDVGGICLELLNADHEDHVAAILSHYGLDDDVLWSPLGGIENNLSIVGNQQSSPTTALVEKVINSIDSLFLLQCRIRGIDPESAAAPQDMFRAAEMFFGMKGGDIAPLKPAERGKLAEHVQLTATGGRRDPCYTIVDSGEGQCPQDFGSTFCSLVRSNKLRIPFVQGKFNMGGSGALPFAGQRNMQLIISRRHPELVRGEEGTRKTGWGFTVVRRRNPRAGARSSSYEYLAPGGQVPCFDATELPVRASRDSACGGMLRWGSVIKLYNYQSDFPSAITFDLAYELSRRLYQIALPVRLCERRDYRAHSPETILTGMSVRVADDRAGVLEAGFPDSGIVHVDGAGDVPVEVVAFKAGKGRSFLTPQAAVFLTVNGQVHGTMPRRFLTREAIKLDFIKNDVMVVLNCTGIPARVREDLFMPSRDRLRECTAQRAIEEAVEQFLADHGPLQRLNRERREQELKDRLADDQPLTDALKSVIDNSPELRSLFGRGEHVKVQEEVGEEVREFVGVKFPTFFRLTVPPAPGESAVIRCHLGSWVRVLFETDAVNDYFTRGDKPGTLLIQPDGIFSRMFLRNGRASLVVQCPESAAVGDLISLYVEVTDPSRGGPFVHRIQLRILEPHVPREREPHDDDQDQNQSGALALPKIIEVEEDRWEVENFDAESGLWIVRDVDAGLVAKVNVDNRYLKSAMLRAVPDDRDLLRKRFVYGLVLAGVSLWQEYKEREDNDELIRSASKAVARILLPTITVLGALEPTASVADVA
ncbi:MAG TPA: hypothetical protein VGR35_06880 [Tepidisphaeraceae bacterium]|nr:hypothetical protein [Tepidisphaeraceae bacterium]